VANVRNRSLTVAVEVCFSSNFAVVFILMYFRFRQVKPKLIGDVLMNKQNVATRCIIFFSFAY
jgi:hypothetical protein